MKELISLQLTMFLLILSGIFVKKKGIVDGIGQKNITNLVIYLILPCNIVKSFLLNFSKDFLYSCMEILFLSIGIQIGCVLLAKLIYAQKNSGQKECLQYGIICSNAGFLGNPIAEGIFGSAGLTLASIYLIPQRIMMWSAGLSLFSKHSNKKAVFRQTMLHPCILACELGIVLMLTQWKLPDFLFKTISFMGNSNTALSMMIIGMILADMDLKNILDKDVILYTCIRLLFIPAIIWTACILLGCNTLVTGISVLLAAMPAGATTSILASKYQTAPEFATKMVIFSTLMSLPSSVLWSFVLT